jgi:hypothetical protein
MAMTAERESLKVGWVHLIARFGRIPVQMTMYLPTDDARN